MNFLLLWNWEDSAYIMVLCCGLDINGKKWKVGFNPVLWCAMCELSMHTNNHVAEWFRIRRKCAEHCTDKENMQCQSMFLYPKPLHSLQTHSIPMLWFFHTKLVNYFVLFDIQTNKLWHWSQYVNTLFSYAMHQLEQQDVSELSNMWQWGKGEK
jgi:hypothetical protein